MNRAWRLSGYYSRMLRRGRSTTLLVLASLSAALLAWLFGGTDIAMPYRLFENLLLSSQWLLLHLATLVYGYELFTKERGGLFTLPLASGMQREHFLVSLLLTLWRAVGILALGFLVLDALLLLSIEQQLPPTLLWQLLLHLLSAGLLAAWLLLLSRRVTVPNATLYAVLLLLIGGGADELWAYAFGEGGTGLQGIAAVIYYLPLNFSLFDYQAHALSRTPVPVWEGYLFPPLYALLASALLCLAAWRLYRGKALHADR